MKKIYKVTSSTTTMFIADVEARHKGFERWTGEQVLNELASNFVSREADNNLPRLEISEVKSFNDLPLGWNGRELVWGADEGEDVTPFSWFNGRSEREKVKSLEEEVERLKEELYFYRQRDRHVRS